MIAALAARQHGVASRTQLLAAGVTRRQIERRVERKVLRPVYRGVYAAGHGVLSAEGVWMAAVLAAGKDAVLSHWSAGSLLRLRVGRGPRTHVTCRRARRSNPSITFHRGALPPDEITHENAIPTTTPARTLLDLAPLLPIPSLTRMVATAGPSEAAPVSELLERYPRRPGAAKLRAIVAKPIAFTRSDLEAIYLHRFAEAGLPAPHVNSVVEGNEVDFAWPDHGVIAELDTYVTHGSRDAFIRDRERDRKLAVAGWRVVRLTDEDDGIDDLSRLLASTAACSPSRRAAA